MRTGGVALLWCLWTAVAAQQAEVTRYDVGQGLPQSMVNHVLQDAEGFLWFGTGDGLARFDGHRFVVHKHDARDSSTLGHNSIWGLAERADGRLWVGTRSGLDLLDRRTGRFEHIATGLPPAVDGCWQPMWDAADSALFYSPLGSMFLCVRDSTSSTRATGHIASYAFHADARTGTVTQALYGDTLLTLTRDGAVHRAMQPAQGGERTLALHRLGAGWLVLTDIGAYTWSPTRGRRPLPPRAQELFTRAQGTKRICTDGQGHLWVGLSGTGVVQLDTALNVLALYPLLPADERPLTITTVTADRQGNIWAGSDGKGVFRIAPQRIRFGRCMPGQGLPWEPPSWFVRGFAQWDAHHVLVSFYEGGQALFDERNGELKPLVLPAATAAAIEGYDLKNWFTDRQGLVWCQDLLQVFALERGSARLLYQEHAPRGAALACSPEGDAVLLTHHAVRRMHWNGRSMEATAMEASRALQRIDSMGVMPSKFALDELGTMVMCQSILPVTAWRGDKEVPMGPFPVDVRMTCFGARSGGDVWMTSNNGLYRADQRSLQVNGHWTVHNGLPDQFLYGMLPAGDGTWWISSNNGLSLFDERTERFTNYGVRDGLQSTEFNTQAFFRSASGRLYFGGVNGFNHFMPGALMADGDTAQVALVGLAVQDTAVDLSVGGGLRTVVLPHGRNHLRVDLAVLEFSAPEANRYRYRVTGYTDWTEHPADRPITLTNMPHGEYRLEVIGVNGDGLASAPRELLLIRVPLPFRNSPWAYVLVGALIIAALGSLAFLGYRHRLRRQQERTAEEMKELRIRTRIAQDLHDDLGSGLARITALSRTMSRGVNKGEDVRAPVEKMTALSQELMHDLRDVVWVNDPRGGDLAELLLRIRDHVQDLFEGTDTACTVNFPAPLPERSIGPAAKRTIYLIAKEAAHNAWKYSAARHVMLAFHLDADHFRLELSDDGKGLPEAAPGTGHGLRNMQARAAEIGCTLHAAERPEGGFQVVLAGAVGALDL